MLCLQAHKDIKEGSKTDISIGGNLLEELFQWMQGFKKGNGWVGVKMTKTHYKHE